MSVTYPMPAGRLDFRIKVTEKRGRSIEKFIKTIEAKLPNNVSLTALEKKVLKHLQMYINNHRQRKAEEHTMFGKKEGFRFTLKNNLYNCFEKSTNIIKTNEGYKLGIGEKRFLNTYCGYWYVLNYGSKYNGGRFLPPPTVGYFGRGKGPNSGIRGEAFHHSPYSARRGKYGSDRTYYIKPRTFTPMYYLNEMAKVFSIEILTMAKRFKESFSS
jgi:hypothetical protein